jgi:hypothetical protein
MKMLLSASGQPFISEGVPTQHILDAQFSPFRGSPTADIKIAQLFDVLKLFLADTS